MPIRGPYMANSEHHFGVREVLGAFALDAVDKAQRADVERHLEDCDACRSELVELREAVRLLPERPEPSEALWKRIMSELRKEGSRPADLG